MSASPSPAPPPQPDYGPTLPQLLKVWWPRFHWWLKALVVIAVLGVLAGVGTVFFKDEISRQSYQQTSSNAKARGLEPMVFNFDYSKGFKVTRPPGSYVKLEKTKNGVLVASMQVSPIAISPDKGLASGYLPLKAVALERAARRKYPGFRLQFEGRSRVNFAEGYQFAFNARLVKPGQQPRQLFGRTVVILEPYDFEDPAKPYPKGQAATRGVLIQMLATTLDTSAGAPDIGDTGNLKTPFRTFRFGS